MPKTKRIFSPFVKQCFVTCAVCSDVISHGCILGYPAVLFPQLREPGTLISLTEENASWIASVTSLAMIFGIFVTPPMMGQLGRKIAHYAVILTSLVGWFMFALATSVEELIIGRIFQGLSFGIFLPLRSVLIGEYTSPKNRGGFLTIISLSQGVGILLIHLFGSFLSWQRTALVTVIFPFVSLIMTIYSPESPSWLADKERYNECRNVFLWLRGDDENDELEEMIKGRIAEKNSDKGGSFILTATIAKKEFYKPILIMIHAYFMTAFSGSLTIATFSTTITTLIMGAGANANFWMVFLDIQRIISNTIAVYVMNKIKRRTMMFSMLGLCAASNLTIAGYVYVKDMGLMRYDAVWLPALLMNIHYFTVGMGIIPIISVLPGEIFSLSYRSFGGSFSTCFYAIWTFLALKTFYGLIENIGLHGTYTVYGGILMYNLMVFWILLPETRGKTLQQIENEFRGMPFGVEDAEVMQSLKSDLVQTSK